MPTRPCLSKDVAQGLDVPLNIVIRRDMLPCVCSHASAKTFVSEQLLHVTGHGIDVPFRDQKTRFSMHDGLIDPGMSR